MRVPQRLIFRFHACWLDRDCRPYTPAHTYITLSGWVWRINPPFSRRYIRECKEPPGLEFGPAWTWHIIQYIGPAIRKKYANDAD